LSNIQYDSIISIFIQVTYSSQSKGSSDQSRDHLIPLETWFIISHIERSNWDSTSKWKIDLEGDSIGGNLDKKS